MAKDPKVERLQRVPLFARLSGRDLEHIARLADEVRVDAGRRLIRQGERGHEFFLIIEGTVDVEQDGRHIATLGPGDYLGEIALLDDEPRTASATAATATRLMVIGHREFHSLMDEYPAIQLAILRSLTRRIRELRPGLD